MNPYSEKFTHVLTKYSRFGLSRDYMCNICGITLYKTIDDKFLLLNDGIVSVDDYEYNCNEWIIKNIVE